jgi:predicted ATPase
MASIVMSRCYRFGAFELQVEERRLLRDAAPVALGPHAFDVLVAMVERAGHLVTKDELLQRVWGRVVVEENTLQAHVSALRKILGAEVIATVSGRGYRFTLEVVSDAEAADKHNLPRELTSFIGREKQISDVTRSLASTRLLTLTGAGGCGKTRLALRVAGELLDGYRDGVWLVELAPLADPKLVAQTVAKALALQEKHDRTFTDTVVQWLEARHALLVMDNAEHLLDACAELAELLLRRCPELAILVTSRERLGVEGELTYRVPSLSVPGGDMATNDGILGCEAARLFIERARLQRPDFHVADRDLATLASICRRLDGIALAIELAAPRVHAMSLEELSARLDDRFGVLTGGSRTALPRHRTLRSLVDWSHELLSDDEKTMLRRASVFAGGWTIEAAEAVCGDDPLDRRDVFDLLASLVDKNLVVAETHGAAARFGMLETIRHYARDRLGENGEEEGLRSRHFEYCHDLASRLDGAKNDAESQIALDRLDEERDNIRAALAWCETSAARSIDGLSLAGRLYRLWLMRGPMGEGRAWVARVLAVAPDLEPGEAHALALHAAATFAKHQGDFECAEAQHRQALSIWRRLGDRRQIARSVGSLGSIAMACGDLTAAHALYEEATAIMRQLEDRRGLAAGLLSLGILASQTHDFRAAVALLEECIAIQRDFGAASACEGLSVLGQILHAQGDYKRARTTLMEALRVQRESANKRDTIHTLLYLGAISHDAGDISTAKAQLMEAFAAQQAMGTSGMHLAEVLEAFACLSTEYSAPTCAARIWGSAERHRERIHYALVGPDRDRCERFMARARQTLQDDAAFDRAWNEGRSWTTDEAVKYAMES